MTLELTIIGLHQIGASIGLSLAAQKEKIHRVGIDKDASLAQAAHKKGAVDQVAYNLPNSVRQADAVILAVPAEEIHSTLPHILPDLKKGAVVLDTALGKTIITGWMEEALPRDRFYVGLAPMLNPLYLHEFTSGVEAANADLFKEALVGIAVPFGTDPLAVDLAVDLVRSMGASPLFSDAVEIDGIMAATHVLPNLLSLILLNTTLEQPGWSESGRLTGRAYSQVSLPLTVDEYAEGLPSLLVNDRVNMLRVIDRLQSTLNDLRGEVETGDDQSLQKRVERALNGRADWWKRRQAPSASGVPASEPNYAPISQRIGLGKLFGQRPKNVDKKEH